MCADASSPCRPTDGRSAHNQRRRRRRRQSSTAAYTKVGDSFSVDARSRVVAAVCLGLYMRVLGRKGIIMYVPYFSKTREEGWFFFLFFFCLGLFGCAVAIVYADLHNYLARLVFVLRWQYLLICYCVRLLLFVVVVVGLF
jgi:hypothetical protein